MPRPQRWRCRPSPGAAETTTEISFYFPVAVGGPITKIIDGYAADFQRENPTIKVTPIYAGTYQDTLTKAQTALKANAGPQMAVLLSTDVFSLIDDDLIVPFDTLAHSDADRAWLRSFYPAFLKNGEINGHTWGVPFQRSTIVLYWNKSAFQDAGLDPEHPPATWAEHAAFAQKLTRRSGGTVDRWGVQIPATGFAYWLFQALVTEAGGTLAKANGTETDFASPACVEALRYWIDLAAKVPGASAWRGRLGHHAARLSRAEGGDDLDHHREPVEHPRQCEVSVRRRHVASQTSGAVRPTGGGNFYLFKTASAPQREAALRFLRWISSPERAAQWGIDTGYVATSPAAWETPAMRKYVADFPPAAVARDQLQYAVAELSTHDNQRVTQALNDGLQAALLGRKTPDAALTEAQATASRLLRPFHR